MGKRVGLTRNSTNNPKIKVTKQNSSIKDRGSNYPRGGQIFMRKWIKHNSSITFQYNVEEIRRLCTGKSKHAAFPSATIGLRGPSKDVQAKRKFPAGSLTIVARTEKEFLMAASKLILTQPR